MRTLLLALVAGILSRQATDGAASKTCPVADSEPFSQTALFRSPGSDGRNEEIAISPNDAPEPGDEAWYACDRGRVLVGARVRTCLQDGTWSGDAPHCYLNLAERSNLTAVYPYTVDGELTTFETLDSAISTGFYAFAEVERQHFSPNIYAHEVLIVTERSSSLIEWAVWIQYVNNAATEIAVKHFTVKTVGHELEEYSSVFNWKSSYGAIEKLTILPRNSGKRPPINIYEIQVICLSVDGPEPDDNSVVSINQCELNPAVAGVMSTWTDGQRCFHLVENHPTSSFTDAESAAAACAGLEAGGRLARVDSVELHRMIHDILVQKSREWSREHILVAGRRDSRTGAWTFADEESWHAANSIFKTQRQKIGCAVLKQIASWYLEGFSCDKPVNMIICENAPQICGTPGRPLGVRFDPTLSPRSQVVNVTCDGDDTGHVSGQIRCQGHTWTQPTFCLPVAWQPIVGAIAASLGLLICILVCFLLRRRRKRLQKEEDDAQAWVSYGFMERLRRISRYSKRQKRVENNLYTAATADTQIDDEDHIYSEMIYADVSDSGYGNDSHSAPGSMERVRSWLQEPTAATATADHDNPLYESSTAAVPLAEYSTPFADGGQLAERGEITSLHSGAREGDEQRETEEMAVGDTAGGEYAVPYGSKLEPEMKDCGQDVPKEVISTDL